MNKFLWYSCFLTFSVIAMKKETPNGSCLLKKLPINVQNAISEYLEFDNREDDTELITRVNKEFKLYKERQEARTAEIIARLEKELQLLHEGRQEVSENKQTEQTLETPYGLVSLSKKQTENNHFEYALSLTTLRDETVTFFKKIFPQKKCPLSDDDLDCDRPKITLALNIKKNILFFAYEERNHEKINYCRQIFDLLKHQKVSDCFFSDLDNNLALKAAAISRSGTYYAQLCRFLIWVDRNLCESKIFNITDCFPRINNECNLDFYMSAWKSKPVFCEFNKQETKLAILFKNGTTGLIDLFMDKSPWVKRRSKSIFGTNSFAKI